MSIMISYIVIGVLALLVILQGWWIFRSIKLFWIIKDLFSNVYANIATYHNHVKHVHTLERYFGDETLKELIEHGESTCLGVEEFLEIFVDFEESGEINILDLEETQEEQFVNDEDTTDQAEETA